MEGGEGRERGKEPEGGRRREGGREGGGREGGREREEGVFIHTHLSEVWRWWELSPCTEHGAQH